MLNNQSLSSSLHQKRLKICTHCKGTGTILVKQKSPLYKGVIEYYPEKCPYC